MNLNLLILQVLCSSSFFFVDTHARYEGEDTKPVLPGSVPPLYDIPLRQVNKVLYGDGITSYSGDSH